MSSRHTHLVPIDSVKPSVRAQDGSWEYYTRGTRKDIPGFVGWNYIKTLSNEALKTDYYPNPHPFLSPEWRQEKREHLRRYDQALVAALILLGGRIQEILMTHTGMFELDGEFISVSGMPVLKRIKKIATKVQVLKELPENGIIPFGYEWSPAYRAFIKREWETTSIIQEREPFPVPTWEPLSNILLEWINRSEEGLGGYRWLFPTPASPKRKEDPGVQRWVDDHFKLDHRAWISHERAWQKITKMGARTGYKIWDHWFRSQRASQLVKQYDFNERHLNRFFGWSSGWASQKRSTASSYAKTDYKELTGLMYSGMKHFKEMK